ncbi:hypothetical protein HPB47_008659, partial [Ixodes persulcatus]
VRRASTRATSFALFKMAMQVTVKGEDISPVEFQCTGWQSAFTKRTSSKKCLPAESEQPANMPSGSSNGGSRAPASLKKRLVAASKCLACRRSNLEPKRKNVNQVKIARALVTAAGHSFTNAAEDIICPNAMQNILVVSTPTYEGVEAISIGSANYEVSSYLAAPDNTCKGIIRNIDLEFDLDQLRSLIVQPRNPKALEARRIKNSTTVVILFDGLKLQNYVMCGLSMLRCTLYRRQTEVCYACVRLGLRAGVCPTPKNVVWTKFPNRPTCVFPEVRQLPGGLTPRPTSPRRKERPDYNTNIPPMDALSRPERQDQGALERAIQVRIRKPAAKETGWADRVRGSPTQASQPPQAPRPAREETPIQVPVEAPFEARTAKKRALTEPVSDERLEKFQTEMRVMLKSLSEAVAVLNAKVDILDGKFNALRGEGRWSFVLLRTISLLRPESRHLLVLNTFKRLHLGTLYRIG